MKGAHPVSIAGRSVWREVVSLTGQQRQEFLTSVGVAAAGEAHQLSRSTRPGRGLR